MVCYDVWKPDELCEETMEPEHGLVVEHKGSIVKVRPLNDWNAIRLLNVADCTVLKAEK